MRISIHGKSDNGREQITGKSKGEDCGFCNMEYGLGCDVLNFGVQKRTRNLDVSSILVF